MSPAACTTAVLAVLLAGTSAVGAQNRDYRAQGLDLLRILAEKPWIGQGPLNRWDRVPHIEAELGPVEHRIHPATTMDRGEDFRNFLDTDMRMNSEKRSAVATALNTGRRRRQPTPALGKAVTPYVGVGLLNDMDFFFDSLRDNLEALSSLSPQQRSNLFQDPPTVVQAPSAGSGGGGGGGGGGDVGGSGSGSGIRRLHALRPLRPTGNIRSYNRRSFVEADGGYPGANHHDPGLLWTGLGR